MKAAGRAANYDPSVGGLQNSLMPSVLPQFAFDGGVDAAQEAAPAPVDAAPPVADQADLPDPSTVSAAASDASQADQTYPVLPLTVVPKPEASPLASLKAADTNQRFVILALVLALLSAVTVIFWRNHRRDYASPRRIGRRD
jgi:cell division septation protein DedD